MMKDILDRTREQNVGLKDYLQSAYIHPVFKARDDYESSLVGEDEEQEPALVPTRRHSRRTTPLPSKDSSSSRSLLYEVDTKLQP